MAPRYNPTQDAIAKAKSMGLDLSQGTHGTVMNTDGSPMREVVPSEKSGRMVHSSMSDPTRAYYTAQDTEPQDAMPKSEMSTWKPGTQSDRDGWRWAQLAADSKPAGFPRARAVVHNVEPVGTVGQDVNLPSTGAMTADKLRVTDTQWIPPATAANRRQGSDSIQGTLPHVNWNQFRGEDNLGEANWHTYGNDPSISATERIRRRAAAPDPTPIRSELPGQMEMVDRPATWYQEARKADI